MKTIRGKKRTTVCLCGCGREKEVREADIKRGWGKFFSKSCKAKYQEKRTGQYANYLNKNNRKMSDNDYYCATTHPFDSDALGQE